MNNQRLVKKQTNKKKAKYSFILCCGPSESYRWIHPRYIANIPTGVKTPYRKCTDGSTVGNMDFSESGSLHLLHGLWRSWGKQYPSFPIISLLQPCHLMCNNNRKYGGIRDLGTLYVWHRCPGGMEESTLEGPHAVHFERAQGRIWELEPFPALPLPHQTGRLDCSPTFILWLPFVLSKYSSDSWSEALPRRILEEDFLPRHS